jgi:hypothetical protein
MMRINIGNIQQWADEIRAVTDDQETFLDTLDGQTDALDVLDALMIERAKASAAEDAAKAVAGIFADRAKRQVEKQASLSRMMGKVLDAIGETKIQRPIGTISRTKARQSVEVYDEAEIPTQLLRTKITIEPDSAAIKAQLEAGETVPGARLKTGEPGITVRIK